MPDFPNWRVGLQSVNVPFPGHSHLLSVLTLWFKFYKNFPLFVHQEYLIKPMIKKKVIRWCYILMNGFNTFPRFEFQNDAKCIYAYLIQSFIVFFSFFFSVIFICVGRNSRWRIFGNSIRNDAHYLLSLTVFPIALTVNLSCLLCPEEYFISFPTNFFMVYHDCQEGNDFVIMSFV